MGFAQQQLKILFDKIKKQLYNNFYLDPISQSRRIKFRGIPPLEELIQNLQESYDVLRSQVNSLQGRVNDLETRLPPLVKNTNTSLAHSRRPQKASFTSQQDNYTLEENKGSYLTQNEENIHSEIKEVEKVDSNILLDDDRSLLEPSQQSEQYHLSLNQKQAQNAEANATFAKQHNFKTLARIPEEERIEIIQTGFRLNQERKISLKKYYQSTDPYILFQSKRYSIRYEAIRKTNLYKQLKP